MDFKEYLEKNGRLVYNNKGVSMLPMIKEGRDFFVLEKKGDKRCKKYDVAMYFSPPDRYVLHRIVGVNENDYVFLGDNCVAKEYGIKDSDILAVMTEFVHKGKRIRVDNKGYRLYSRFWYFIFPIRKCWKRKVRPALRRVYRKIYPKKT